MLMQDGCGAATSRRSRLSAVTKDIHRAIDQQIGSAGFLVSRTGYNAYVLATLHARRAVERQLEQSAAAEFFPAWEDRRLTGVLEQDLADLQLADSGDCQAGQRLSRGGVWGALYVLEGSALGARILARRVAALGVSGELGARHLARQTSDTGAWRRFVTALDAAPLSPAEEIECDAAALAVFGRFKAAYRRLALAEAR